jgi:hypothetical protein
LTFPISASQVARITGESYWHPARSHYFHFGYLVIITELTLWSSLHVKAQTGHL